jgi:hypothetical protein
MTSVCTLQKEALQHSDGVHPLTGRLPVTCTENWAVVPYASGFMGCMGVRVLNPLGVLRACCGLHWSRPELPSDMCLV